MEQNPAITFALNYAKKMAKDNNLPKEWSFGLNNNRSVAGRCIFTNKTIEFSRHYLIHLSRKEVKQLVAHELAHALIEPRHRHNNVWRNKCLELGGNGERIMLLENELSEKISLWRGVCPSGHKIFLNGAPSCVYSCSECSKGFDMRYVYTWYKRDVRVRTTQMPARYRKNYAEALK